MEKKKNSTTKQTKWSRRKTIVALSAALGVAGVTAIVAPVLVSVLKKGGTTPTTETIKLTFNAGEHGSFTGGESKLEFNCEKGQPIGSTVINAVRSALTTDTNFSFSGWYLASGDVVSESTVLSEDSSITAQYLEKDTNHINISFGIDSNTDTLKNFATKTITITKGTTYGEICTSLPVAVRSGYKFNFWVLTKGGKTELESDYEFNESVTLYPYFTKDTTKTTVKFRFEALSGQTLTGDTELEFELDSEAPENDPTWASITTWPTVKQTGKVFSGWYHDSEFKTIWASDDKITEGDHSAYALMVAPDLNPVLTFSTPENLEPEEAAKYTWYGNQIIKCSGTDIPFNSITPPIPFYDPQGEPSTGISSNGHYFSNWYILDDAGNEKPVPGTISTSLTIYPKFKQSPTFTFVTNNDDPETLVKETKTLDPNLTFKEVALPIATTAETNQWFIGWKQVWTPEEGEEQTKIITPDTKISDIDETINIVPNWQENCHGLYFLTEANIAGTTIANAVKYSVDNPVIGAPISTATKFGTLISPVPTIVDAATYSFEGWEYTDHGTTDWVELTDETEFPTGTAKEYDVRPVLSKKITIKFDAGAGTISSEWYTKLTDGLKVKSNTPFSDIYTPNVTAKDGEQFICWCTKDDLGNLVPVESDTTFAADTTLYAKYGSSTTTSIVNFYIKDEDAPELTGLDASVSCETFAFNHTVGDGLTFDNIPHATATKDLHTFTGWELKVGDTYEPIEDGYALPYGGTINVYAGFERNKNFHKVSVVTQESNDLPPYEVIGENKLFVKHGDPLLFNEYNRYSFGIEVKSVGYEVKGWTLNDEAKTPIISEETLIEDDVELLPVLEECKRRVTFSKNGDTSITGFEEGDEFEVNNYADLLPALTARGIVPDKPQADFVGWQIKDGDTFTTVTNETVITGPVTVVPLFRGESEWKTGNLPYYYDSEKLQWAAITSFDKPELQVRYANGEDGTKDKSTFNYEVRFGELMTSIPSNFMLDCVNWNNGATQQSDDNTLKLPSALTVIGDNVLKNCHSFNQKIDFSKADTDLTIGEGFMSNCYSFSQNLDLSYTNGGGTLSLGNGFMYECRSFANRSDDDPCILNLSGRTITATGGTTNTLVTTSSWAASAVKGFTVQFVDEKIAAAFESMFPSSTTYPFRHYVVITK